MDASPEDYRCLYGHRVPARFTFAIQNNQCPQCGAQLASLTAYTLARRLVLELQLDPRQAFAAVRLIEGQFRLVPLTEPPRPSPPPPPRVDTATLDSSTDEIELSEVDEPSTGPTTPPDPSAEPPMRKVLQVEPVLEGDSDFGTEDRAFFVEP
jgi:hypothetical protein